MAEHLGDILRVNGYSDVRLVHDRNSALEAIQSEVFGLVLLDIQMEKQMVGLELAKLLNEVHYTPFIYITAHSDKKIIHQAIETKPRSYITKPFKGADVIAAIELAFLSIEEEKTFITFKDGWEMCQLEFDEILFARSDGNYIQISTAKRRYIVRYTLDWFIKCAPSMQFHRIHRNTVVNLNKVKRLSGNELLVGNETVIVSRSQVRDLKKRMDNN